MPQIKLLKLVDVGSLVKNSVVIAQKPQQEMQIVIVEKHPLLSSGTKKPVKSLIAKNCKKLQKLQKPAKTAKNICQFQR